MAATTLAWVVLGLLAAERFAEIVLNRRHTKWLARHGARWHGADGFTLILLSQIALFALPIIETVWAPWAGPGWWTWPLLVIAFAAQVLRYWVIQTLGSRWNIRVVTLPGAPRITTGPYRFLTHPNYLAVAIEAAVIPLALGAWLSACIVVPLALTALARRIRFEETALDASIA